MFEKFFRLKQAGTTVKTECIAGSTTFMTMSYIIFVQPAILAKAGMDFSAVMAATCISSALATFLMGILANYPIALAPAMGHNFFFVYVVCLQMKIPWPTALGLVFISGSIFVLLSFFGFREKIIEAIPSSLKYAIAAGIGLFIALIGFQWAGIIVAKPGTMVGLGDLRAAPVLLALVGLLFTSVLLAKRIQGAILIGMLFTAIIGVFFGMVKYQGICALPSFRATFFKLDILGAMKVGFIDIIFVFFFLDLFDTIGTLIGVSEQAGFIKDGKLPRAKQALLADALGTVAGSLLGTSTVTSYIESSTGVAVGGRTGLTNMVTASLFLLALFFYPLAKMIGGGFEVAEGIYLYPVIAPPLILVGSLMVKNIAKIDWDNVTDAVPAFLTLTVIPFSFNITEGIAVGFISYAVLKLLSGKRKEVHPVVYIFALLFVLRYLYL